ncbi:porin, partial [Escherichia fergusonii]
MSLKTKLSCAAGAVVAVCASVGAHAQSSVTLYGVVDNTVEVVRTTGANKTGSNVATTARDVSNSSLWGLRGNEDLG